MRVVLYYDLLRFSPRSIDLFISMNISPPNKQKHPLGCARLIPFAMVVHCIVYFE